MHSAVQEKVKKNSLNHLWYMFSLLAYFEQSMSDVGTFTIDCEMKKGITLHYMT